MKNKILISFFYLFFIFSPSNSSEFKFDSDEHEQGFVMITLASFKCFAIKDGVSSSSAEEVASNFIKENGLNINYLSLPQVDKASTILASKYKNNCNEIYNENLSDTYKLIANQKSKRINKNALIRPTCEINKKGDLFSNMAQNIGCLMCQSAYELNLNNRVSALSGDLTDRDSWISTNLKFLKKWKTSNPNVEDTYQMASKITDAQLNKAKTICPSLY